MTRLLYIDCVGGAAGDMLLAALLDAGADESAVRAGLASLGVDGLEIDLGRTERGGIDAARLDVVVQKQRAHRTWKEIRELIADAGFSEERIRRTVLDAFRRLAEAEARVHGIDAEEVHFHEVGALDAIADVCGVALALDNLAVERVVSSPLPLARGLIDSAHGRLPLPAPATLELLRGAPVYGVDLDAELVTPTGATLITTIADEFGPFPAMRVESIGYGAGSRTFETLPNVVRAVVGEAVTAPATATVSLIEANLDDLSPELVPDAAEACFAAGALDVWATPVQMKKGRPGIVLSALARPADERAVAEAIFRETSTLGLRIAEHRRWELEREHRKVEVGGETVRVKVGLLDGEAVNVAPEHDDCAAVAARTGRSVKSVWAAAFGAVQRELSENGTSPTTASAPRAADRKAG